MSLLFFFFLCLSLFDIQTHALTKQPPGFLRENRTKFDFEGLKKLKFPREVQEQYFNTKDLYRNNRLIIDVGVEGAGHHVTQVFIRNMFDCSLQTNAEEYIDAGEFWVDKWNHRFVEEFRLQKDPPFTTRFAFQPMKLHEERFLPKDIEDEAMLSLENLVSLENYRKNGVTAIQWICSWPCGKSKSMASTLHSVGRTIKRLNEKHIERKWDLGVLILVRDPVETVISHSREYIVHPDLQANLTRMAFNELSAQLNGARGLLRENFIGFAFSNDLLRNLYSVLYPSEEEGESFENKKRRREMREVGSRCLMEISKFFRQPLRVMKCTLEKTGEKMKGHHASYGRDFLKKNPNHDFKERFEAVFDDQEYEWPTFRDCEQGSSRCLIPSSCLPFLNEWESLGNKNLQETIN